MSAYATRSQTRSCQALRAVPDETHDSITDIASVPTTADAPQLIDVLIRQLADRVAAAVADRLRVSRTEVAPEWLDSREAAEYLGLHRDTLRKLAAERAIPAEQDGPGCKLFFQRSALDEWRLTGGRSGHLASTFAQAA